MTRMINLLEKLNIRRYKELEEGVIEEVIVDDVRSNWHIKFSFKQPLEIKIFEHFIIGIRRIPEQYKNVSTVTFEFKYKLDDYEYLPDYYDFAIRELVEDKQRVKSLLNYDIEVTQNKITVLIPSDASFVNNLLYDVSKQMKLYGIQAILSQKKIKEQSVVKRIERESKEFLDNVSQQETLNQPLRYVSLNGEKIVEKVDQIKDIPADINTFEDHRAQYKNTDFVIEGQIFKLDVFTTRNNMDIHSIYVYDGTDSIMAKLWARKPEEKAFYERLEVGKMVKIKGSAVLPDKYDRDIILNAHVVEISTHIVHEDERQDLAPKKRIELKAHTKMSAMNGISDAKEYIEKAKLWGMDAIGFTDINVVQSFPDIDNASKSNDIKPIYGTEMYISDPSDFLITNAQDPIDFHESTFVVFDVETTSLSVHDGEIIEIAAIKVKNQQVIDRYETFVKPVGKISEITTKITGITDQTVANGLTIETMIKEFSAFIEGTVLVAHNARFDVRFIRKAMRDYLLDDSGIVYIDTLSLAMHLLIPDLKRFHLKGLANYYNLDKQESVQFKSAQNESLSHHSARYDTEVLRKVFLSLVADLKKRYGIKSSAHFDVMLKHSKAHLFARHQTISIIAKNQIGLKNLYKLVSLAHVKYFNHVPMITKREIEKHREGLLIGSGFYGSHFFETALNRLYEEMETEAQFFDFLEIAPPSQFQFLEKNMVDPVIKIQAMVNRIIKLGETLKMPVVAVSDAYHVQKSDVLYRDVYIQSAVPGGGYHPLKSFDYIPSQYFHTTEEMLDEFAFLDKDLRERVVIENTHHINNQIESIQLFPKETYQPKDDFLAQQGIPSVENKLIQQVSEFATKMYGNPIHPLVRDRLELELNSITKNKFASVYYISHLMVKKSLDEGYVVGSRGSVGSSVVATFLNVTEVNPLPPHYVCPKCQFSSFKMTNSEKTKYGIKDEELHLQTLLDEVDSGFDLEPKQCPICHTTMKMDGHDIPFSTFLGFKGDKTPDIDLNFSGDFQSQIHDYVRDVFGHDYAFRSGTISTIKQKKAFGFVKGYMQTKNLTIRQAEIERMTTHLEGVKQTTGQHPGGIIVLPRHKEIFDITPIQYPADASNRAWYTTHYDYHKFENNLFKLDILGHDNPTMIRFLMDFVEASPMDFPFTQVDDIPVNDKEVYKLLQGTDVLGLKEEDIRTPIASYGVPEFGTKFARDLLMEAKPQTFADIVKVSGLSHGDGVWKGNSYELTQGLAEDFGVIPFKDVIGCRDDITSYLNNHGIKPELAFEISEYLRKTGLKKRPEKWGEYAEILKQNGIANWYIWSCSNIMYLFPKAHATAYVISALQIAWFKLYKPLLFYAAFFSIRAKDFDIRAFLDGAPAINERMDEIIAKGRARKVSDDNLFSALEVALEMVKRGYKFLNIDIDRSEATRFVVDEERRGLIMPFVVIAGLGQNSALKIIDARKEKGFISQSDFKNRTRIGQNQFDHLLLLGCFDDLPEDSQLSLDL